MNIDKVLNNSRLVKAVLGVSKKEFESLLVTFEQILLEFRNNKERKRKVGGGSKGNIKSAKKNYFTFFFTIKLILLLM
jgi:hypothetical protein